MFGRGAPKFNTMHKKASPKCCSIKKNGASRRAYWNPGLEKGLVEILLDHNNDFYRGQNGWPSEAWNRVVRLFHEKFPHASFTNLQIQEKEKELKREYNMLKEARKQSGASWDDRLGMIQAEPTVWDNIIVSIPKIWKFQTKPFPLFDALGQLHDGHTAEGSMNFTSLEATPSDPSITQNCDDGHIPPHKKEATMDKVDKYLELRAKQVEAEVAVQARAAAEADDFSIKKCMSREHHRRTL
ncbi:hypothetical protein BS78_05G241400 [Paspalum vaginatum]|nr:hypothetical protein BS78_05G241400 [Paspalum vaginatum]